MSKGDPLGITGLNDSQLQHWAKVSWPNHCLKYLNSIIFWILRQNNFLRALNLTGAVNIILLMQFLGLQMVLSASFATALFRMVESELPWMPEVFSLASARRGASERVVFRMVESDHTRQAKIENDR